MSLKPSAYGAFAATCTTGTADVASWVKRLATRSYVAVCVPYIGLSASWRNSVGNLPSRAYQKSRSTRAGADDGRASATATVAKYIRVASGANSIGIASLANVRAAIPGVDVPTTSRGAAPASASMRRYDGFGFSGLFGWSADRSGSLKYATCVPSRESLGEARCAVPWATIVSALSETERRWRLSSPRTCTTYATREPSALTVYAVTCSIVTGSAPPNCRIASGVSASFASAFGVGGAEGVADGDGAGEAVAAGDGGGPGNRVGDRKSDV